MQSILQSACAGDPPNSYSAESYAVTLAAARSGPAHHTGAASSFAATYSVSAAIRVSS